MVVRKKALTVLENREKLGVPPELADVARAIRAFQLDQGDDRMGNETEVHDPESAGPIRKKKVAKKVAAKKGAKKIAKKVVAKESNGDSNLVTLAQLCEETGVDGATARRHLRASDIEMGTASRWSWPKKSAAVGQVRKLLSSIAG